MRYESIIEFRKYKLKVLSNNLKKLGTFLRKTR